MTNLDFNEPTDEQKRIARDRSHAKDPTIKEEKWSETSPEIINEEVT